IYLSVWATMPLAAVCGAAAGFPPLWLFVAYFNISALILLSGCLGLIQPLESRSERPGAVSAAHGIMVIGMLVGLESSIGGYVALVQTPAWQASLEIWGAPVPLLIVIPLASLLLAGLLFRIAVRRLTHPVLPPLDKLTAYGILAGADV